MHADLKPRFAYGRQVPWIRCDGTRATLTSGPGALAVSSPVPLEPDWDNARLEASLRHPGRRAAAVHARLISLA